MTDAKPAQGTPLATADEVKVRAAEQKKEWGTYVAIGPIHHNGVLAYTAGDPVPVSNVELHGYDNDGLVAKVDTKAGQDVIRELHENGGVLSGAVSPPALPPVSMGVPVKDTK
jgi:hypothetical protein